MTENIGLENKETGISENKMGISLEECGAEEFANALEGVAAILRCPVSDAAIVNLRQMIRIGDQTEWANAHDITALMSTIDELHIPFTSVDEVKMARAFAEKNGRLKQGVSIWDIDSET